MLSHTPPGREDSDKLLVFHHSIFFLVISSYPSFFQDISHFTYW